MGTSTAGNMNKGQEAFLFGEMSGQHVQMNLLGSGRGQGLQQQQLQVGSGHSGMDPQLNKMRRIMCGRIVAYLREMNNAAHQSLEQLANRLENEIHKLRPRKADYHVMLKEPIEPLVREAIRVLSAHGHQRKKMLNQTQTTSICGTMAPPLGSMSSDYWDPCTSVQHNSTTSSILPVTFPVSMQRQETHMIVTPGFSNQHTLRANPEYLNVAGYFNGDLNAVAQVQQKQQNPLSVNQNTYPLQQPVNHVDFGVHSRMQVKSSLYDLSDPQIDDGMGLHGSNMLLTNIDAASEAFISLSPYCSYPEKALKPELHLPTAGGISASENVYYTVSSSLTPMRTNPRLLISQTTKQHLQPESEVLDKKEKVNFRKSELSQEQLLQQPHQLKTNHSCSEYGQNQEVLKQCELGLYSKETRYNDKRDHMSGQLTPQNTHTVVPSDSQQLLSTHVTNTVLMNNEIQDDCCQGTMSQDLGQQPVSCDWLRAGCSTNSIDPELSNLSTKGPELITENIKYYQQLKWLILLNHANSCQGPPCCKFQHCDVVRDILKHIKNCQVEECSYRYCRQSKMVISHSRNCVNKHCPVCCKAKESLRLYSKQSNKRSNAEPMEPYTIERTLGGVHGDRMDTELAVGIETFDDQPSVSKRIRQSVYPNVFDSVDVPLPRACSEIALQKDHPKHVGQDKKKLSKQEPNMKTDMLPPQKSEIISVGAVGKIDTVQSYVTPGAPSKLDSQFEQGSWLHEKDKNEDVPDISKNINCSTGAMLSKTGKTKAKVISLMEIFTPEQVYEHIRSIRQWFGQNKAKAEKNQAMGHSENENSCQLCKLERLTFEPPPIYCSPCGSRIKQSAPYYIATISESGCYNFCAPCYTECRGDSIFVNSIPLLKSKLEKRRNDDELEEAWVACDKCKSWQHQICALFNAKRNDEEKDAEFTCHYCYIQEINHGLRAPLPQSTVLGAKDLPRTLLSNHIEEHLFKRLKKERQDRAKKFGKNFDEVPGVEGLVVRVVSSVDKKLEVKPQFLEIFQEENYPTEFPYKSKAILLFQRIEGVEVCIFGMYVQEFGTECGFPNQRRLYLSYLDSVKYFRPEIETVSGEALRTFVYHEILIGYLQYCKQRGFTSCYIWACPPLKGDDYIMYCHPEIQKTPKSEQLREWYISMLEKAIELGIVVERTNLYDYFFIHKKECKAKVTAARLPYFDGDYWPGAAEDMINKFCLTEGDQNVKNKGKIKSTITKRDLKAAGVTDLNGSASKDAMLMQKLGELICPMKEDFIMVHLQYSCSHCCILMVSGRCWECNQCKSFYICDKCYNEERQREEKDRHPSNSTDLHTLHEVEIVGVPEDTKDRDDIIESEFFDTREAFLSLCQGNHYQYDTLRRAKHSSMMLLHHLHNPTEPAFVTTCNVCDNDIKTGQGWRCKECDYDECAACYQENGGINHVHRLTKHSIGADRDVQNIEQNRVQSVQLVLRTLTHAVACHSPCCQHPNCRKLKILFHHGTKCQQRLSRGCPRCKKIWSIIHHHVRVCKESQCRVPRCRDVKEHRRRQQQESETRRRAAVNEMMRQRAVEAGGGKQYVNPTVHV